MTEDTTKLTQTGIKGTMEYKNAHAVIDGGLRDYTAHNIRNNRVGSKPLTNGETQQLLDYIDLLEQQNELREANERNATPEQMAEIDSLLAKGYMLAERGVQKPDGYDYIIKSENLVELQNTLRALCAAVEKRLKPPIITESVKALEKWLFEFRTVKFKSDIAELALDQLRSQHNMLAQVKAIVNQDGVRPGDRDFENA